MKMKKFLLYGMASACFLTALPPTPVYALTLEQLTTDSASIDVYFHDDGADLTALTEEDITATLDGSSITIENFEQSEQRINYMFLLDISRSVPEEYMTAAKQEILTIYENLNEEDLLSVITFGNEVHTILEGTETFEEAQIILDDVHCTNGYTHFYDAIDLMLERLEGTSDMRNVAVVVSDGINTGDVNTSIDSLQSRLSGSGIALYALAVDSADASAIDSFQEFIQSSGGQLFTFSPETCQTSMQDLQNSVDSIWNVLVQVDPALVTGQPQTLEIQIGEHGTIQRQVILEQRVVDTTPPSITEWAVNMADDTLALHFSESMADLKDPTHYQVTNPDSSIVPVTVLEHDKTYVLLSIPGLNSMPGWSVDFLRLMDASPNRNLLEDTTLLLTSKLEEIVPTIIVEEEVTPTPVIGDEPSDSDVKEQFTQIVQTILDFVTDFITDYHWQIGIGFGILISILLLILIVGLIVKSIRKKKAARKEAALAEESVNPATTETFEEEPTGKIAMSRGSSMYMGNIPTKDDSQASDDSSASKDGSTTAHVNAPTKEKRFFGFFGFFRSSSANSYLEEEQEEESGIHVNSQLRDAHIPTRKGTAAEEATEEFEVDKVSEHRRTPKARRRVRRNWFLWKKKESPVMEETKDTDTSSEESTTTFDATEEIDDAVMRKYVKQKKTWFWQRKKKNAPAAADKTSSEEETPVEEIVADTEEEIDEKTLRKYVKPGKRRNWFKKNLIPFAGASAAETDASSEEIAASEETAASEAGSNAKNAVSSSENGAQESTDSASKKVEGQTGEQVTAQADTQTAAQAGSQADTQADANDTSKETSDAVGTSIKSGGFSLTGISADYRPSFLNISFKPETKIKNVTYKNPEKLQSKNKMNQPVKTEKSKKTYMNPSVKSSRSEKTYHSSKAKKVHFTFTGDNQKKKN